jgi:hypothetical protein
MACDAGPDLADHRGRIAPIVNRAAVAVVQDLFGFALSLQADEILGWLCPATVSAKNRIAAL